MAQASTAAGAAAPSGASSSSAPARNPRPLYLKTPLLHSAPLSEKCGHNVYLKLDALQPSGSFKFRGISHVLQRYQASRSRSGASSSSSSTDNTAPAPIPTTRVISSSGGNAGLAAATAARMLQLPCTVFCPTSTEAYIVDLLRAEGAEVVQSGAAWDVCDGEARKLLERITAGQGHDGPETEALYVHPFEGEDLLEGHSSMVREIYEQLADASAGEAAQAQPDMIVCSVGGGGLLGGILQGIEGQVQKRKSPHTPPHVVAVECFGADSFSQSFHHPQGEHVTLPAITSAAKSLGALRVSAKALQQAKQYGGKSDSSNNATAAATGSFSTVTIDDDVAAYAAWQFAKDTRLIVELACSASLAPIYFPEQVLQPLLAKGPQLANGHGTEKGKKKKNIVIIVCGGSKVTTEDLEAWRHALPDTSAALAKSPVWIDGKPAQ